MVVKCEECGREFEREESLEQHKRDKHGAAMTSHERKEIKKEEREKQKMAESDKTKKSKLKKRVAYVAVAVLIIGLLYGVFTVLSVSPTGNSVYDLSGIPNGFVHWHADVDIITCGNDRKLPEALPNQLLGTHNMHTHDKAANLASLPASDGNGVIHTEGTIRDNPTEHTLGRFLSALGIKYSETSIYEFNNGDLCSNTNTTGTLKVFINDQETLNWISYLPRDGDFIRLEFG